MDKINSYGIFFTWDIHYSCNYNCTYCFLRFEPQTTGIEAIYLNPKEWFKIWSDIYKKYGASHILVTGGEPFTYPDFIDLISRLSDIHTFEFSTNLSWDVDYFIKKLSPLKAKIDSSFHPEFINLDTFLKKVLKLKEAQFFVSVTFVAYPPFIDKIEGYKKMLQDYGIELIIYPYRGPYQNRQYPQGYTEEERGILKKEGFSMSPKVSDELLKTYDVDSKRDNQIDKKLCYMGSCYAKIVPSGGAYRCCAAVNKDWGYLGNIIKGTFKLSKEVQECPDYSGCRCYKAMVSGKEKEWQWHWRSISALRKEILIEKKLEQAKALRNEGKHEKAMIKINEILSEGPGNVKALTLLGEIYMRKGDFPASKKALQDALRNNPRVEDCAWIYRVLGRLYCDVAINSKDETVVKQKNLSQALWYLSEAIRLAQDAHNVIDKAWAHFEIANVYSKQKDYSNARKNINIALEYEPENEHFKELNRMLSQLVE